MLVQTPWYLISYFSYSNETVLSYLSGVGTTLKINYHHCLSITYIVTHVITMMVTILLECIDLMILILYFIYVYYAGNCAGTFSVGASKNQPICQLIVKLNTLCLLLPDSSTWSTFLGI